jgi:nitrate/nitrite-specific signal transduction histidine kinase
MNKKEIRERLKQDTLTLLDEELDSLVQIVIEAQSDTIGKVREIIRKSVKEELYPITEITNPQNTVDTITKYKNALDRILSALDNLTNTKEG